MATPHGDRILALELKAENESKLADQYRAEVKQELAAIHADLRKLNDTLLAGKGGWKVVVVLLGMAATVFVSVITAWASSIIGPR